MLMYGPVSKRCWPIRKDLTGDDNPKIALYQLFHATWDSTGGGDYTSGVDQRLSQITPAHRQVMLLTSVEGFSVPDMARIMRISREEAEQALVNAQRELERGLATSVLIIEDEPIIALDLTTVVERLGHRVCDTARTPQGSRPESQPAPSRARPCRHPACRQLLRHRCGPRHSFGPRRTGYLHHRLSRAVADRRTPRTDLSHHQTVHARNGSGHDQPGAVLCRRTGRGVLSEGVAIMFSWALLFFIIAIVCAVLGFTTLAGAAATIAQILFVVALALAVLSAVFEALRGASADIGLPSPSGAQGPNIT